MLVSLCLSATPSWRVSTGPVRALLGQVFVLFHRKEVLPTDELFLNVLKNIFLLTALYF